MENLKNVNLSDEIIKAIQILVNKATEGMNMDYTCYVSRKKEGNKYYVLLNEQEFLATNISGQNLNPRDLVLVHCVNGNFGNKVIIGKY